MIFFSNYNIMKVVVFDFDVTLGHFGQLGDFVTTLEEGFGKSIKREVLYKLLDIYPFTLRTDLFRILNLLKRKKQRGDINKVIIYTNNMGPRSWVLSIKRYLELKLNYKLFDRVISAYKVNGVQIEKKRTSHDKTYKDLCAAANLPKNTKVLFFDDQPHSINKHKNVTGIRLMPYTYIMNINNMIDRFLHNRLLKSLISDKENFSNFMYKNLKRYDGPEGLAYSPNERGYLFHLIDRFSQ